MGKNGPTLFKEFHKVDQLECSVPFHKTFHVDQWSAYAMGKIVPNY